MTHRTRIKSWATVAAGAAVLALMLTNSPLGKANDGGDDREDDKDSRVQIGFAIAPPAHLNLAGKDRSLVGLGSYLVNAVGDCNGCHSAIPQYVPGGDPFMGQPTIINQAGYLAGGNPLFGPLILPRNLTPDKTGKPAGGATYQEFRNIMRTGIDPDHAHPQFGPFLQVMPWPVFRHMTENDLRAIYEYLSAIPCVEGDPGLPKQHPLGTRCK